MGKSGSLPLRQGVIVLVWHGGAAVHPHIQIPTWDLHFQLHSSDFQLDSFPGRKYHDTTY